ncbi:MAG: TIGR00341 family protein, partial [Prochlorococcus sp.]|nr:TIGR00341 family protein [Prochlorococcus sp.]
MEITRLGRMHNSYKSDANLDEVFVILTIGASMIATLGLQANSAAVVIGAMVVAPWIMPLRASAFAVLIGDLNLLLGSLKTLFVGVVITIILSALLGEITDLPRLGSEVMDRTSPTLLDLGIAIVAGGMASYAKLRSDAISSLAGTAIAVALVPPVCVMGILLSYQHWSLALGAGLLFATNLLGILMGGLVMMAWKEPFFRQRLRENNFSAANFLLTGGLTALLVIPLTSSFLNLVGQSRRQSTREQIEYTIKTFLKHETLTFGGEGVDLAQLNIAWDKNPPEIHVLIYVSNPKLPTVKQVSAVQEAINKRQGLDYQLIVQRVVVIEGPEEIPNLITKEDAELIKEPTPIINPLPRTKKEQEISKDEPEEGREIKP